MVFQNDAVAYVVGVLVGSTIAGLGLMIIGYCLYKHVRKEIEAEDLEAEEEMKRRRQQAAAAELVPPARPGNMHPLDRSAIKTPLTQERSSPLGPGYGDEMSNKSRLSMNDISMRSQEATEEVSIDEKNDVSGSGSPLQNRSGLFATASTAASIAKWQEKRRNSDARKQAWKF